MLGGDGRTVLFVSHNMEAVKTLCSKCLFLKKGKVQEIGPTKQIIKRYLQDESARVCHKKIIILELKHLDLPEQLNCIYINR